MSLTKATYSMISGAVANVLDYGAIGDGTTECAAAFQAAINTGKDVFVPIGTYKVSTPLNITNKAAGPFKMFGEGWGIGGNGSIIKANTGGVCLDFTGSQFMSVEDLVIDSATGTGLTTPSTIGILFARSTTSLFAQFNTLKNVRIYLPSIPTANGNKGTIGLYNCAAEIHHYDNVYFQSDNPIVFTGYNDFSIASPYQTISTIYPSMSMVSISGASTFHAIYASAKAAVYVANAFGFDFRNVYTTGDGNSSFYVYGSKDVSISGHTEGQTRIGEVISSANVSFRMSGGNTTNTPFSTGVAFNIVEGLSIELDRVEAAWPVLVDGGATSIIAQTRINIAGDDGTKQFTNIGYVRGFTRLVNQGTVGGLMDQTLVGTPIINQNLQFVAIASATAANNTLYKNSSDGKIYWKDNSGTSFALY
jgi:Pectate lyase superfamily protein